MSVRRAKRRHPETGAVSECWMVDIDYQLPDGRRTRIRKVSPVQTRRGAEQYEREVRQAVADDRFGREEVPRFDEFKREFMTTYVAANNKPSERISKESMFKFHLLPSFGRMRLDEIGTRDIERFKAEKLADDLSAKTVNNLLTCLGKMLRYAAENEIIEKIPRVKFVKVAPYKSDFLEADEWERLVDAAKADPEAVAAVLLGGDAGLRVGEIRALEWGDLDLVAGRVTVQRTDYRGYIGSPKGGRMRMVPLTRRLVAALKAMRHLKGKSVFSDAKGVLWSRSEADTRLRRARVRAGLRKFGWHTLRHTFCSHLAMRGAPPRAIQELAGHASITTTMRYMHLSPTVTRDAIRLLERQHDGNTDVAAEKTQ